MRIRLSDRRRVHQLVLFLSLDPNAVVNVLNEDELEVSFLGSLNIWAQQRETELRLRTWMAWNPDVIATLTP